MEKIVDAETVNKLSHPEYTTKRVKRQISRTQIQERALSELIQSGIISDAEHKGTELKYKTQDSKDTVATSVFAVTESIAYLSWIWVAEPFRANGIGTKLTEQTVELIKRQDVDKVYTIPKSSEAELIFDDLQFKDAEKPLKNWRVKEL